VRPKGEVGDMGSITGLWSKLERKCETTMERSAPPVRKKEKKRGGVLGGGDRYTRRTRFAWSSTVAGLNEEKNLGKGQRIEGVGRTELSPQV